MSISVLLVNLNNLQFTKDCIVDLISQDCEFNLTIIDQNSTEEGTKEYFSTLPSNIEFIQNGSNVPLNNIWNWFVSKSNTPYICLLNNDVRIAPNFLSSAIQVLEREPIVGFVNHISNNKDYQEWSNELSYKIIETPYRQGWDPIFRKESYNQIPNELSFFYGDDYIYSKLYSSGMKGAYVLNSPMIHFERSTTVEKGGQRDASPDGLFFSQLDLEFKNMSFVEDLSRWKPEFNTLQNEIKSRIDVINFLSKNYNYIKYLEIGIRNTYDCFDHINCLEKDSVDPGFETNNNIAKYKYTSDSFFSMLENDLLDKPNNYKWDLIFIDGLHTAEQVEKDIINSLNHLSENGSIVLHDCNPPTEYHTRSAYYDFSTTAGGHWNGTVWKSVYKLRCTNPDVDVCVVDIDWGCGVVRKGKQRLCEFNNPFFEYEKFDKSRQKHLNLIPTTELNNWLKKPYYNG